MRRRPYRLRPLVLGPDRDGRSCVVSGDRTCFFGAGPPPPTPGALRLPAPEARIGPGRSAAVGLSSADASARARALLADGVTSLVALVADPREAGAVASAVHGVGLRVVVAAPPAPELAAAGLANPWSGIRFVGHGEAEGDALPRLDVAAPPEEVVTRAFGRRFVPLEEGAVGDVVAWTGGVPTHVIVAGAVRVRDGVPEP